MEEIKEAKFKIPLFDGNNFDNWKFRMETLLDELDLLEFVQQPLGSQIEEVESSESTTNEKEMKKASLRKADKKCKSQIIQRVGDSHLEYVKDQGTSFEIWETLKSTFMRKGIASQLLIRKTLLCMKFNPPTDTLESHFLKFDKLIRNLKSTGATLEETDVVCHLLLTMPTEYDVVVTALETLTTDQLTLGFVKNRLLDEQTKKNGQASQVNKLKRDVHPSLAFSAPVLHNKPNWKAKQSRNKGSYRCHNCGMTGHFRADCKRGKQFQQQQQANMTMAEPAAEEEQATDYCFIAQNKFDRNNITWYLDSGASEHLVNSDEYLINVKVLDKPTQIKSAKSGALLSATKIGDMNMEAPLNNRTNKIVLKNVLLVPGLEFNLLSVPVLEKRGFTIIFDKGKGTICKENKVIAVAERRSKLYELNLVSRIEIANLCEIERETELWHRRLGHISNTGLRKLVTMVDGINIEFGDDMQICKECVEGKQTKLPHNEERFRARRPLELIHSDLFGPVSPESYDGHKYILTFIDDYSHFTAAYPLKSKGDVFHHFRIFESMATTHFNLKISRFRCDNGREYISRTIKTHFEQQGIQFEFTIRHTPQQNGVAERMNRTIVERARCMLYDSKLPKSLWTEAVLTAVYLINRSPTIALKNEVPAGVWYGKKPNLNKLKIFGSTAYLHLPKALIEGKFDSRTKRCFMIGYCNNGYRLWSPEDEKVLFGRDVIFDETPNKLESPANFINADFYEKNQHDQQEATTDNKSVLDLNSDSEHDTDDSGIIKEENVRRSQRPKSKPRYLDDYAVIALNVESFLEDVPQTYHEINGRNDKVKWLEAVDEEINSLNKNNTWTLTTLPPGEKAIDNMWVFKIKRDPFGNIEQYKARLVAKGCAQRKGFDYSEVYAPVARLSTIRTLLSIINHDGLHTRQMDVKNAFLHGNLEETIFMKQPEGFTENPKLVCKLNKALYGLKQAPRAWNLRFDTYIKQHGLRRSDYDECLYTIQKGDNKLYMILYVDDIIIASNNSRYILEIKKILESEFCMKDMGEVHHFLGIQIQRTAEGMMLRQENYLKNLLKRFNMEECKGVKTPMQERSAAVTEPSACIVDLKPYRELVGCLMYVTLTTRPDLSAAVNYYSRFQSNATEVQWMGLKRILRYIQDTVSIGLFYSNRNSEVLIGYADSDWAGDIDRKSTTGYLFEVYGAVVSWATRKQSSVALSSTEAEYVALATAATELLWLKGLLKDLFVNCDTPIVIFEDNQSCIHLLSKREHCKLKHVDIKYNFIRDLFTQHVIDVKYVPSADQKADILTKPLCKNQFIKLRLMLGFRSH